MAEVCALSGRVSPAFAGPIRPIPGRPSLAPPFLYPLRHALPCGRDTTALRRWGGWGLPCCPVWRGGRGGCVLSSGGDFLPPRRGGPPPRPTPVPFCSGPLRRLG